MRVAPRPSLPATLALVGVTVLAVALVGAFAIFAWPLLSLPADLLMFSETAFIENVIKLNIGRPLYTPATDSNSIVYPPLAFLATYAVAWPARLTRSVAGLRTIQLGFTLTAAALATITARQLRAFAFGDAPDRLRGVWIVFTAASLALVATSPRANQFTFALHVDAFGLLVSMTCFWALVSYYRTPAVRWLVALAVLPAVAFMVKQSLAIWLPLAVVAVLARSRSIRTALALAVGGATAMAALVGAFHALWGEPFLFWTFEVLSARNLLALSPAAPTISLARAVDHLLRIWPESSIGLFGGYLLLRHRDNLSRLGPLVLTWLLLVLVESYASASGWGALYHFGPGVLVGAIFLFAALPHEWAAAESPAALAWPRAVVFSGGVLAMFLILNVVPNGDPAHPRYARKAGRPADVYRYIDAVDREFQGLPADQVLLGVGSWEYLKADVLQRDRAVSLADQPATGNYANFDVTVGRIRAKTYRKLLLQNFDSPFFWYDWAEWPRSSGFRQAVLDNYVRVRTVDAAAGSAYLNREILLADTISVFEPKP